MILVLTSPLLNYIFENPSNLLSGEYSSVTFIRKIMILFLYFIIYYIVETLETIKFVTE